ncbi:MAG: hypothetical protein JOZ29_17275 [Deltaproteobacteria bacterium]|nr:hypothetical protein [Deltaproteobacteria bacterium]
MFLILFFCGHRRLGERVSQGEGGEDGPEVTGKMASQAHVLAYGHGTKEIEPTELLLSEVIDFMGFIGATRRIRTDDLLITNQAAYVQGWLTKLHCTV